MTAPIKKIDLFLSYLSETYTKSLALYDLVTSQPRSEEFRILLNINEVFTYYHSTRIFYYSTSELEAAEALAFFEAFEEFYFELKQIFFLEDDNTTILYKKLTTMKEAFEVLTDFFNVL
ncbi:hypothetical protein ACSFB8_05910 [Enterococcus faecalis]